MCRSWRRSWTGWRCWGGCRRSYPSGRRWRRSGPSGASPRCLRRGGSAASSSTTRAWTTTTSMPQSGPWLRSVRSPSRKEVPTQPTHRPRQLLFGKRNGSVVNSSSPMPEGSVMVLLSARNGPAPSGQRSHQRARWGAVSRSPGDFSDVCLRSRTMECLCVSVSACLRVCMFPCAGQRERERERERERVSEREREIHGERDIRHFEKI